MTNEVEIELKRGGHTLFEYHAHVTPRIGEIMAIDVDEERGLYEVTGVAHNVFRENKSGRIRSYVTVYLEKPEANGTTDRINSGVAGGRIQSF